MTKTFIPITQLPEGKGFAADSQETIQGFVENHGATHVRLKTGEVYRIGKVNQKSVSFNDTSAVITSAAFTKINALGTLAEEAQGNLDAAVKNLTDQGVTIKINPAPSGVGEFTQGIAESVERVTGVNPIETPAPAPEAPTKDIAHAERAHAILSASGASRWLACPPSALLEAALPDSTSDAAAEGTAAHELAEHKLRLLMGMPSTRPESHWHDEDMESHTDDYADCCMAELAATKEKSPAAFLSIEERLDFSHIVPEGFGTGDTVIVGDDTMTIIDLKYGKGVKVDAEENPQMKLYALGALNMYGFIYNIQKVRMIIFQPRLRNTSIFETTVEDLLKWADEVVKPTAQLAIKGEGAFAPGEHCGFCRHAPQCEALMQQHFSVVPEVLTAPIVDAEPAGPPEPGELTDEQIAQVVIHADAIKKWLTKVESHAKSEAANGNVMPGLKLVAGRANRRWTDQTAVAEKAQEHGVDPYKPRELVGLGDMQKRFGGKKNFDAALSELIHKPEGAPTLVPDTDPRPALQVATAETVFQPIKESA
ncbi:DUF2800 domain-containing protein [Corynebacterium glutamicum]|uniref:DUF2800 domain-containing protein n=1 Tax=Corynebacterium glutamicum TaxID=1718 RepID=UPI001467B17B|nr:DUF2800 domain-containing protein [Corynebacterium glutamicum]GFK19294.1 hypothetical protein KbCgl_18660 [Corynebacterium glutamicum]